MLKLSIYGEDLTLTQSVLNETVFIRLKLFLNIEIFVCVTTVDKVLRGLAACICRCALSR